MGECFIVCFATAIDQPATQHRPDRSVAQWTSTKQHQPDGCHPVNPSILRSTRLETLLLCSNALQLFEAPFSNAFYCGYQNVGVLIKRVVQPLVLIRMNILPCCATLSSFCTVGSAFSKYSCNEWIGVVDSSGPGMYHSIQERLMLLSNPLTASNRSMQFSNSQLLCEQNCRLAVAA